VINNKLLTEFQQIQYANIQPLAVAGSPTDQHLNELYNWAAKAIGYIGKLENALSRVVSTARLKRYEAITGGGHTDVVITALAYETAKSLVEPK
jgi:hypothetical protein